MLRYKCAIYRENKTQVFKPIATEQLLFIVKNFIYVYVYVCVYIYISLCVYIYIYTYIHLG